MGDPFANTGQRDVGYGNAPRSGYGYNQQHYSDIPIAEPIGQQGQGRDIESQDMFGVDPNKLLENLDAELRLGFVRKVFTLLGCQLAFTFGAILLCSFNTSIKSYFLDTNQSAWLLWLGLSVSLAMSFTIMCCNHLTRIHPHNLAILALYTISQTVLLTFITVAYNIDAILYACGITAAIVGLLILYASQTKYDFTGMGVYLYVACWALILTGFVGIFTRSEGVQLVYALLGVLLFSFFLVYDTQLIIGGNHKLRFSVDDHVMAALMLYIDIIEIFIFILRLIGKAQER